MGFISDADRSSRGSIGLSKNTAPVFLGGLHIGRMGVICGDKFIKQHASERNYTTACLGLSA